MKLFPGVGFIQSFVELWESLQVLCKLVASQQLATWTQKALPQGNLLFLLKALKGNVGQNFCRNSVILTSWKEGRWGMKLFLGVGDIPSTAQLWDSFEVLYKLVARQRLATLNQKVLLQSNLLFLLKTLNGNQ